MIGLIVWVVSHVNEALVTHAVEGKNSRDNVSSILCMISEISTHHSQNGVVYATSSKNELCVLKIHEIRGANSSICKPR